MATLDLLPDGSFREQWHFNNEYNGRAEGDGEIAGHWKDNGRDWFVRDITVMPFVPLAQHARGEQYASAVLSLRGYSGVTSIEADVDIVFFRR